MDLADQYVLCRTGRGALLLDISSGALAELNESAAFVWELFVAGRDRSFIVREAAARYGLETAKAAIDVDSALVVPQDRTVSAPTDFNYRAEGDHYVFEYRGKPAFLIDAAGDEISLVPDRSGGAENLPALLHAVAPKILSLRGHFVLHAGAVAIRGQVLAFSGLSGAGKSTTARSFATAGAEWVCDDQLLIDTAGTPVRVTRGAETAIDAWIVATARELRAVGRGRCEPLDRARDGERLPLTEIGLLDRNRRSETDYSALELTPTAICGALFRNIFHGSQQKRYWKDALETTARLGQAIVGFALTPPRTLDALASVARARVAAGTLRP